MARMQHPEEQAIFNDAMTGNSRSESQAVLEAYDFSRFKCVVDIGGGQGLLLKEILFACPSARGVLFDQPHVIASAQQVPTELARAANSLPEASLKLFLTTEMRIS